MDVASLPADADIAPEWDAFIASLQRESTQLRIKALFAQGFHEPGDVETRLGHHVGKLGELTGTPSSAPVRPGARS